MKAVIMSALLAVALCSPAHAFSLRKVLGAPGFAVGFVVAMTADLTVVPLRKGFKHYVIAPAIKGW